MFVITILNISKTSLLSSISVEKNDIIFVSVQKLHKFLLMVTSLFNEVLFNIVTLSY